MAGLVSIDGGVFHIKKRDGNPTCTRKIKPDSVLEHRPIEDFDEVEVCYSCLHTGFVKAAPVPKTHQAPPEVFLHRKDFYDKD